MNVQQYRAFLLRSSCLSVLFLRVPSCPSRAIQYLSPPRGQHRVGLDFLAIPEQGQVDLVAGLGAGQGVAEVLEVVDFGVAEADDDVVGLQAGLLGGAAL